MNDLIGRRVFFLCAAFALVPANAVGQIAAVIASPVDHPVSIRPATLTPHLWKNTSGAWGETLIDQTYKLRGYDEVLEIKSPGGQGIDRLALKYDSAGNLVDVRFGEAKTHFGGKAKLSNTKLGLQLSRKWLADKITAMRNSADPRTRTLALDISRFRKERGVPIESLGEFHDVGTRSGRYIRRNPISGAELSNDSIEHLLKRLESRASTRTHESWVTRSLAQWDQIQQTGMTSAFGRQKSARLGILQRSSTTGLARATRTTASRSLRRLARAAGPIGVAVALAIDAHEIYSHVAAYQRGEINRRDMVIALSKSGGGIVGAGAGAATGAWIGTFGGPLIWMTVPAGATIGGIVGYFAGSTATGAVAQAWYSSIDEEVKNKVDVWIVATSYSELTSPR